MGAEHPVGGIEPHQPRVRGGADIDLGLDRRSLAGKLDHQLRAFHPVLRGLAVGLDRQELKFAAVQAQWLQMLAVTHDFERRSDARPLSAKIEIEPDLRNVPVRCPVVLASDRDMSGRERRFGTLRIGDSGGSNISHFGDLGVAIRPHNPAAPPPPDDLCRKQA